MAPAWMELVRERIDGRSFRIGFLIGRNAEGDIEEARRLLSEEIEL